MRVSLIIMGITAVVCLLFVGSAAAQEEGLMPYALTEALTEEQAFAMGGDVRIISSTRAIASGGCFDLSGAEPVKIDDEGTAHAFRLGDNLYQAIEGEDHLLLRSRELDRGRDMWTYTLALVGCMESKVLYQRTFSNGERGAFEVAELFASAARELVLSEPDHGLSRLDITSSAQSELTPWLSGEVLWQNVVEAHGGQVPFSLRERGEVEGARFVDASLHPLDEDTYIAQLHFAITFVQDDMAESFSLVVKLEEGGEMEVLRTMSARDIDAELAIFPQQGVFQVSGEMFPLRDLSASRLREESFPVDLLHRRMFGYDAEDRGKRLVLDAHGRYVTDRRVLTADPARVDFDRDGLSSEREQELGTSDIDQDSDEDGVVDGVEVSLGRDPAVAQDRSPGESVGALGLSNTIMEWEQMARVRMVDGSMRRDLLSHFFYPFEPSARITCKFPIGAATKGWSGPCFDHELEEVTRVDFGKNQPRFISRDEVFTPEHGRVNISTGEAIPEPIDLSGRSFLGATKEGGLILAPTGTLIDRSEIFYQREPGQAPVSLRLTGAPVDLAHVSWVSHLGSSEALEFFAVDAYLGRTFTNAVLAERWLYAARGEEVFGLFELRSLLMHAGVSAWQADEFAFGQIVGVESPGGYILRLDRIDTRESIYVTLDESFRLTSSRSMPRVAIGAWWREGFLSLSNYRYRVALANSGKPDSRCISLGGVIACDTEPGMIYMASAEIDETNYVQLIPSPAGLGPDDVLLSVHQDGLWRYAPDGAVSPWLGRDALASLRVRSEVIGTIEDFEALAIRRDRRAVCAVAEGQLYLLQIDEHGEPERLEHVERAGEHVSACGWDAPGGEVVWATSSGEVFSSGEARARLDVGKEVHAILSGPEGEILTLDTLGALRCHDASGEHLGSVGAVLGAALFDEALVYVDRAFLGPAVISLDAVCEGRAMGGVPLRELASGESFWTQVYAQVQGSILSRDRVESRRSGVAVVARDQILVAALEVDSTSFVGTVAPVPFRVRPSYPGISGELAALVGEPPYREGMTFRAATVNVLAMANSPSASLDRSPGYHVDPPASPPVMDGEGDMGLEGEGLEGEGGEAPGGCTCQSASRGSAGQEVMALLLLCLVVVSRRRAPRSS